MADQYVTDPELLKQLNSGGDYVTDPELLKQLGSPAVVTEPGTLPIESPEPNGPVAPMGIVTGPAGYNVPAIKQTLSPIVEHGGTLLKGYGAQPAKAIVDIGAAHLGLPPPYATVETYKALKDTIGAVGKAASEGSKIASQGELFTSPVTGSTYPETVPLYRDVQKVAGKDVAAKMSEAYSKGGGNAVLKYLNSAEIQAAAKADPALAEAIAAYSEAVPSKLAQAGKIAAPVLRTVGKVLGPAGMALNAYEAQQYAKESQLGQRLAQGQGQAAQQAFRNMNVPYGQGFTNTITPDQAQNVLDSGSERDIQSFGGRERLNSLAQARARQVLQQPPTAQNFIERMKAMSTIYSFK